MKNYCCYEERPHFDMHQNFDNMNFEEINIGQNCNFPNFALRPCHRPMPCHMPIRQMPNCFCNQQMLWLIGGIIIGKILD